MQSIAILGAGRIGHFIGQELADEKRRFTLFDQYDTNNGYTSMARCTGYSCIQFVKWLTEGTITRSGVIALEQLGSDSSGYRSMMQHLREKGISITDQVCQ